jgi:hypothetical protein
MHTYDEKATPKKDRSVLWRSRKRSGHRRTPRAEEMIKRQRPPTQPPQRKKKEKRNKSSPPPSTKSNKIRKSSRRCSTEKYGRYPGKEAEHTQFIHTHKVHCTLIGTAYAKN